MNPYNIITSFNSESMNIELSEELCHPELLHHIFENTAEIYPDNLALQDSNGAYTYKQLNTASNRLAHYLKQQGIGRGNFVAILLERSNDVYIAILAVLKTGAAYVPLDPDYPAQRIQDILEDSKASLLLSSNRAMAPHIPFATPMLLLDECAEAVAASPGSSPQALSATECWKDPCYVIFTSGSTGRPKGVVVEHRNACNLVRASACIYQPVPTDRVLQGFSIAFDAAVEEVWLALASGAALIVGSREAMRSGPVLSELLNQLQITVLSCVPTLLATAAPSVPTLRLLILGGEACPPDLVAKWWSPNRRMLNTYGPTEATVIATWTECHPAQPVTIGRPLPNYGTCILDELLQPCPAGVPGELHLSGAGIARGYMGKPELTAERFIQNPFSHAEGHERLYKTGDLTMWDDNGSIVFLGRVDSQVKFRGYRIELSEIEAVLREQTGVANAVVALKERENGIQLLAAYITSCNNQTLDLSTIRESLRSRLPAYMFPSHIMQIEEIPTLSSGKADRSKLPEPAASTAEPKIEAAGPMEIQIARCWQQLMKCDSISLDADFFLDLGGHSLLAALAVSELRKSAVFADIAVSDIYAAPSVRQLAAKIQNRTAANKDCAAPEASAETDNPAHSSDSHKRITAGILQAAAIFFLSALVAAELSIPLRMIELSWKHQGAARILYLLTLFITLLLLPLFNTLMAVAAKWIIIGRYKPGRYPLWGSYYLRWWLVRRMQAFAPVGFFTGTPLYNLYLKCMGADIATDACIATSFVSAFDLLHIGQGASIGYDAHLNGYTVQGQTFIVGSIYIADHATVGHNSVLAPNTRIGRLSTLQEQSMLMQNTAIPNEEVWSGSPASFVSAYQHSSPLIATRARLRLFSLYAFLLLAALDSILTLFGLPFLLAAYLILRSEGIFTALALAPIMAVIGVSSWCILASVIRRALGRVPTGRYPLYGSSYLKRWMLDRIMLINLNMNQAMYATIFMPPWLRMMGAKVGRHAEVSTASHIIPDLLEFGESSFIADAACIGAMHIEHGVLNIHKTSIGSRAFVGNSALIPQGYQLANGSLIGVMSVPPDQQQGAKENTSWLGSPAMFLPRRQESKAFSPERTYQPTRSLYLLRFCIESLRVTGPAMFAYTGLIAWLVLLKQLVHHDNALHWLLLAPLAMLSVAAGSALIVVLLKWLVMGKYKPVEMPLWSNFVWRTELITALYENVAVPALLGGLTGTPFLPFCLRLFGAKIGKSTWIDTIHLSEFDLVHIEDNASINLNVTLQTHLFEDRVMKMDALHIGKNCTLGEVAVILYSANMEEGSSLEGLSLLMKGETLPAFSSWHGIPAQKTQWHAPALQNSRVAAPTAPKADNSLLHTIS